MTAVKYKSLHSRGLN